MNEHNAQAIQLAHLTGMHEAMNIVRDLRPLDKTIAGYENAIEAIHRRITELSPTTINECCSFCSKSRSDAYLMIKYGGIYLCDSCIHECQSKLDDNWAIVSANKALEDAVIIIEKHLSESSDVSFLPNKIRKLRKELK